MATRTRTVVFTDLANYTLSVSRANRAALRELVALHERTVTPVLERRGGRVVKNLGDSFMALFGSATDAVRAGLELVDTVTDPSGFAIRVGMATGDVEEIDGDAFGEAVNRAHRVLGITPSGEVRFDEATLHCMNQAEVPFEPVGRFGLKGIPGDVLVLRAVPAASAWLPLPVRRAVEEGRLVRVEPGDTLPSVSSDSVVLLDGFAPGSDELRAVLARLPALDPAHVWLATYTIPPVERIAWERAGHGLVIGLPAAIERALRSAVVPARTPGSDTIILDRGREAVLSIRLLGLALPRVPLADVVDGYTYDLLRDGRWVDGSEHAVARVHADRHGVRFEALVTGSTRRGRHLPVGEAQPLEDGDEVHTPAGPFRYRAIEGDGYFGILLGPEVSQLEVDDGGRAEIGREPVHPGLVLPDRRGADNLRWCTGARAERARQGGFTLERALVGRRQCAVIAGTGGWTLEPLHERCPTWLLREGRLRRVLHPEPVRAGDLLVLGTSVIEVAAPDPA